MDTGNESEMCMSKESEVTGLSESTLPENYDVSVGLVHKARNEVGTSTGILLTLAETANPGQDISSYKKLIKREMYRLADYLQSAIYTDLKVQDEKFAIPPATPDDDPRYADNEEAGKLS